jgi:hypothetical protein
MNRAIALVGALLFSLPAQAEVQLTLQSLKTYAYDEVVSWQERDFRPYGLEEVVAVEGMVILDIRAVFDVPWSDELDRLSVSSRDIALILPDGTEVASFGSYEYWGMMHTIAQGISISRPRDYPEEDEDLYWQSLYLVPEGTASAVLRIGDPEEAVVWQGDVTVPGVEAEQDAAMFAEFRVTDVDRFRVAELEDGRDTTRMTSTLTAPAGQVLVDLEIEVTALSANEFEADGDFQWHSYDFRLTGPEDETFFLVGERFQNRILDWQFNGVNVGEATTRRLVFMVPEGTTAATLRFGMTAVAEVDLSGPVGDRG